VFSNDILKESLIRLEAAFSYDDTQK